MTSSLKIQSQPIDSPTRLSTPGIPERPMSTQPRRTTKRRLSRGQAMVEYSMLNWVLIVGLVLGSQVHMIPGPKGIMGDNSPQKNLIELFLEAYQTYYDSYYFVLNLPFP